MADDDDLSEDSELDEVETPDFEGIEEFDDEDFDDEFDDDFEEELEDEYDFNEFNDQVTEEDLAEADEDLSLVGDFVDEDEEEEKVVEEQPEEEEPESKKPSPKKGEKKPNRKKGKDDE